MAWTAQVQLDPDKSDIGTAAAIWNAGGPDEFRFSRRARIGGGDVNAFVSEAHAAKAAHEARTAEQNSLALSLANLLNAS